jgi:hypothetical protein
MLENSLAESEEHDRNSTPLMEETEEQMCPSYFRTASPEAAAESLRNVKLELTEGSS